MSSVRSPRPARNSTRPQSIARRSRVRPRSPSSCVRSRARCTRNAIASELLSESGVECFRRRIGEAAMKKRIRRRHEAYARAHGVCTEHSALFDATPGGQKTRAALGTHVAEVARLLTLQEQSIQDRRKATEQCRLSRQTLRDAAN